MFVSDHPVNATDNRIGIRETCLLLIAGGFAALMFNVDNLAIVTGWAVVVLWTTGMIAGPRPTTVLTFVYGAGLFVTTFWWPREGWWPAAIALMWAGIGLIGISVAWAILERMRSSSAHVDHSP